MIDPSTFWPWALLTIVATGGLLTAEYWGHVGGRAVLKTIAALGFLGAALSQGLANQGFALWVTIGLALSVIGDLCLLAPTSGRAFLTGIGAFLLAHVAYFVGFWTMGIAPLGFGLALMGLAPLAWALHRWLTPDVPERLQRPVMAYILVIIGMVAGAVGAWMHTPTVVGLVPTAGLFLVSDVGVAMQRFKSAGFRTKLWAQPAYFVAQLAFAWHTGWLG